MQNDYLGRGAIHKLAKTNLLGSTDWIKLEQDNGDQAARFFQVITFPQPEYCTRYSTMNSN